ncbi:hypothetical protein [Rossellomorea vietnamensis]|uniref:hypothetical protein n=1 Tax=Rossellomorea vietnamensis TaxID=218284 RepID=UPI001E657F91|nr:hypothetical protein [Rossellomorea vietnamensis]MCC5803833.1 hypothetical protein [Rossellomorea vietnamensis]
MIDRELVEQIVIEVLRKLHTPEVQPPYISKPNLLVIGDIASLEPEQFVKMESSWNLLFCDSLEHAELHTAERVVFLEATQDLLVKGALGIGDTPESELLSRCILEYVPVTLIPKKYISQFLFDKSRHNSDYVKQLLSYKKMLLKFGVKVEEWSTFINHKREEGKQELTATVPKKPLLTQRDVQDHQEDEIKVDQQTIITPLARDTARDLGKRIKVMD